MNLSAFMLAETSTFRYSSTKIISKSKIQTDFSMEWMKPKDPAHKY
jgi:hypothetical protein